MISEVNKTYMRERKGRCCVALPHDFHVLKIERASQHCEKQSTREEEKNRRKEEKQLGANAEWSGDYVEVKKRQEAVVQWKTPKIKKKRVTKKRDK